MNKRTCLRCNMPSNQMICEDCEELISEKKTGKVKQEHTEVVKESGKEFTPDCEGCRDAGDNNCAKCLEGRKVKPTEPKQQDSEIDELRKIIGNHLTYNHKIKTILLKDMALLITEILSWHERNKG